MSRAHNFSAGPAVLPLSVVEELRASLPEFGDTRQGLMELSHRSAAFEEVIDSARMRIRRLLGIPDDYQVLLLQGGASLQFFMSALNLTVPDDAVDYIDTGAWSSKAVKEAARVCRAELRWSGKDGHYTRVPGPDEDLNLRPESMFCHYTSNNTIYGTQWHHLPATDARLVVDLSSDICSRPVDIARHDLLYAGAQKNLGPSGVTAVVLSPWAIEQSRRAGASRSGGLPSMLDYGLMADKGSMFNTPNTFGIYALERVLAWMERQGGVSAMSQVTSRKSAALYSEIDRSDFWLPHADVASRSDMNITWRIADDSLVSVFLDEAAQEGLLALRGHRSVGGLRASIYNACPEESVRALVDFMINFEGRHG